MIIILFTLKKIENLVSAPFSLVLGEAACSSGGVSSFAGRVWCLAWTVGKRGGAASGGASSQPGMLPKYTYRSCRYVNELPNISKL